MMQFFINWHRRFLSEHIKERAEQVIVTIAILSFIIHLLVIALIDLDLIRIQDYSDLFINPISAIYTPFSFILVYEAYLLIYYLPRSITIYIAKQYEIITLILIRRLFKDLSKLELDSNWFQDKYDLQFTYDLIATIILFFLIFVFYHLLQKIRKSKPADYQPSKGIKRFIQMKKVIATVLVPILIIMGLWAFGSWLYDHLFSVKEMLNTIYDVNDIFFDQFFTVLILTDVLLLLISLYNTSDFSKVIRNSGFIISTILIRLSFSTEGLTNILLIVVAVLFGVLILAIHNQYQKVDSPDKPPLLQ